MKMGNNKVIRRITSRTLSENRSHTFFTLLAIVLSTAMISAVCGFAASGRNMLFGLMGVDILEAETYAGMVYTVAAVFGVIIVAMSVIVASNAFRVSAGERTKQFGLLKAIGATNAQVTGAVICEGIFLCVIGIPTGGMLGSAIHYIGAELVQSLFDIVNVSQVVKGAAELHFDYMFSWEAMVLAALVSLLTVLFSAWLPARKVAKISPIDAIRQSNETALTAKDVKILPFTRRLFGAEGVLAAKYVKRNRRSFRATVMALCISIALFVVGVFFGDFMEQSMYVDMSDSSISAGQKAITLAVRLFVFGFVALLVLIAITNIVSTVITNMRLRNREFALLRSIGMSKKNFAKMLRYESVLSCVHALVIGVFLGSAFVCAIYAGSMQSTEVAFHYPWFAVVISAVGVAVLMFGMSKFAERRVN
jgi:ABC-type antimicrobial peptide transport system permease subunit